MSNIIAKAPGDIAALSNEFWGEMDTNDFKIPKVSIGQPTTAASKGKPGHFNYSNGKSVDSIMECKLILPKKTRVLYKGKGRARCKSDNYYHPSKFIENPISSNCLTCFASQWGDDQAKIELAKELNVKDFNKPLCSETYNLLMADINWMPFWASFQKGQLKIVGEKLFSRLRYDFAHLPPYGVAFDLKLIQLSNDQGTFYNAVFENFRAMPDYAQGERLYNAVSKKAADMLAQEHEQMDVAHDNEEIPF